MTITSAARRKVKHSQIYLEQSRESWFCRELEIVEVELLSEWLNADVTRVGARNRKLKFAQSG